MRTVSYIIIIIMIMIYFMHIEYTSHMDIIDYPLRAFYHADMNHLIANMVSFYGLSFMEEIIGSKKFLFAIIFIWLVSSIILLLIHSIFPSRKKYTIGFSGVIFGLLVVYFAVMYKNPGLSWFGLAISILPQLFVPGISFEGHLAGIFAGIIYLVIFPLSEQDRSFAK
jgi:rhomboid domain-containing protein 1